MTVQAQVLIDRSRRLLLDLDLSLLRWPDTVLIDYLNEAQYALVNIKPSAYYTKANVTLASGTSQSLPAGGIYLLDITRNVGGRYIKETEAEVLTMADPDWTTEAASPTVKYYVYDPEKDRKGFQVYPQNDGVGQVEMVYSVMPPTVSILTDNILLDPIYEPALVNYVVSRALSEDGENAVNQNLSDRYYKLFINELQAAVSQETVKNPT